MGSLGSKTALVTGASRAMGLHHSSNPRERGGARHHSLRPRSDGGRCPSRRHSGSRRPCGTVKADLSIPEGASTLAKAFLPTREVRTFPCSWR